jgi:hypothetical protein
MLARQEEETMERAQRLRPRLAVRALSRAAGPLAALLGLCIATATPAHAYLWERTHTGKAPTPVNFRCSDIWLPKTIELRWTPGGSQLTVHHYVLTRDPDLFVQTTEQIYVDSFDFQYDHAYGYSLTELGGESAPTMNLPPPPPNANPEDIFERWVYDASDPAVIEVQPEKIDAAENQAVDSRLDLRYGNPTLLDFAFGSRIYRGGLFAGFASDPARVGRSFLKYTGLNLPQQYNIWASSMNCYFIRGFAPGSTTIGCQGVDQDGWNGSTLKWSTAPVIDPGAARRTATLTWTSSGGGGNRWVHWSVVDAIDAAFTGDHVLSAALASMGETNQGWAYFAKKEFDPNLAPCLVYALRAPLRVASLTVTPFQVTGGSSATGKVVLNGPAPAGGAVVHLSADVPAVHLPATVTVPEGAGVVTFTITTDAVEETTLAMLTATYGESEAFDVLEVDP